MKNLNECVKIGGQKDFLKPVFFLKSCNTKSFIIELVQGSSYQFCLD